MGGSAGDGKSMIWPMKVFRGKQPYDPVNKTLVTPHTGRQRRHRLLEEPGLGQGHCRSA
jgi:hypothetical protein